MRFIHGARPRKSRRAISVWKMISPIRMNRGIADSSQADALRHMTCDMIAPTRLTSIPTMATRPTTLRSRKPTNSQTPTPRMKNISRKTASVLT